MAKAPAIIKPQDLIAAQLPSIHHTLTCLKAGTLSCSLTQIAAKILLDPSCTVLHALNLPHRFRGINSSVLGFLLDSFDKKRQL